MKRLYGTLLHNHFSSEDMMAFLSGPRQVGKTTTSKTTLPDAAYLNWDVAEHRETILKGAASIYKFAGGEDWSIVQDPGARYENFIASHLLKLVHSLTDNGYGTYELFYLRDKEQREVDFCVTRNNEPWFILEAKMSSVELSSSLEYFQKQIEAPHAFQAVFDLPFVDKDCFTVHEPVIVPAVTLLSQLV